MPKYLVVTNRIFSLETIVEANGDDEAYAKAAEIADNADLTQYKQGPTIEGQCHRLSD